MGTSACSCRRSAMARTMPHCSPRSRRQPPSQTCRSVSKATRRHSIRASTSSRSRPIPASSRSTCTRQRHGTTLSTSRQRVYEEAAKIGLGAEKFRLDGRHVGTGGGNHIVLGGVTPADSPFLRRPDLLASIIAYWQNHPSLSYLFSGLFIGPTSQAPRVDEARHEIALRTRDRAGQIPEPGGAIPPWLVDRLFRNLLVDVTGNTHRAEICIDKLYSPEAPMGRLGLVEFRAFEMPPHPRMSLAQQLLIRALVARFWEQPYRQPLVRWGTTLHDRFMLPHFLWADFESVIGDLQDAGLPMEVGMVRCPTSNFASRAGARSSARASRWSCGRPWNPGSCWASRAGPVPPRALSTLRSSACRCWSPELTGDRHVVTCNGYPLPLTSTGRAAQAVAGVRFRAWPSAEGFHPTIAPHVPLTLDIVDTWNGRSIGGCRYHVAHPGGRNFQTLPVNALEAEGRRLARFETIGHPPGGTPLGTARRTP